MAHLAPKIPYKLSDLSILDVNFPTKEIYEEMIETVKEKILPYVPIESWKLEQDFSDQFFNYISVYSQFITEDDFKINIHFSVNSIYASSPLFITRAKRIDGINKTSRIPDVKVWEKFFQEIENTDLTEDQKLINSLCKSVFRHIYRSRWKVEKIDFLNGVIEISTTIRDKGGKILDLHFTSVDKTGDSRCFISIHGVERS